MFRAPRQRAPSRRGAGVVDRDGLENRCTDNRTEGSNPSLSASLLMLHARSARQFYRHTTRTVNRWAASAMDGKSRAVRELPGRNVPPFASTNVAATPILIAKLTFW